MATKHMRYTAAAVVVEVPNPTDALIEGGTAAPSPTPTPLFAKTSGNKMPTSSSSSVNARCVFKRPLLTIPSNLLAARQKLAANEPGELLASDLRAALDAFGQVSGKIDNERILDQLFASFCIGK